MSNKPITQEVEDAVNRFWYLVEVTAKKFSKETALNPDDFSLKTRDFIQAATDALLKAAKEKGVSLREGYAQEAMKNAIINTARNENKHDPVQIDLEANFLDFYNAYLGGIGHADSNQIRDEANAAWLELKPTEDELQAKHATRVRKDSRLANVDDQEPIDAADRTRMDVIIDLLWKRKQEYSPVPYRMDLDGPVDPSNLGDDDLTLEDTIPGSDPTKDNSYEFVEVADIDRQIKHFQNRRFVDNSAVVRMIRQLVIAYTKKLKADASDLVSMRAAWRLTLLYLLATESSDLQKRGYEVGTTIKDILLIPDLIHLCHLAGFEVANAVKMKPVEAKTFLLRAKRELGIQ